MLHFKLLIYDIFKYHFLIVIENSYIYCVKRFCSINDNTPTLNSQVIRPAKYDNWDLH